MYRAQSRARAGRQTGTARPGIRQLEIVPQRELHASRRTRGNDPSEEGAKIRVIAENAPVRMIERVEALHAKADCVTLTQPEIARQCEIEEIDARSRQGMAPGIAERVLRRRGECRRADEL